MKANLLIYILIGLTLLFISCGGGSTTEPDITPPDPPANLTINIDQSWDGVISFSWEAPVEEDIRIYRIYRSVNSAENFSKIDSTVSTVYRDVGLDYNTTYYYYVTSVDNNSNESDPSTIVNHTPFNQNSPATPSDLAAVAHNRLVESFAETNIILTWTPNTENDFFAYIIFRDTIPGYSTQNNPDAVLDSIYNINTVLFTDTEVEIGKTYFYRIVAVDKGGLMSNPSNTANDTPLPRPQLYLPLADASLSASPLFVWEKLDNPDYQSVYYKIRISEELGGDAIWSKYVDNPSADSVSVQYDGPSLGNGTYYWKVLTYSQSDSTEFNSNSEIRRFYLTK